MRLVSVDAVELDTTGVRRPALLPRRRRGGLVNAKRAGAPGRSGAAENGRLSSVSPTTRRSRVTCARGADRDELLRAAVTGRLVEGPWSEALSELAGKPIRVARTERKATASTAGGSPGRRSSRPRRSMLSVWRLAADRVDGRRFRMTIGVDGVEAHAEDGWIGERIRVGGAVVAVRAHVGRCAVTTRDPDTGIRDLDTLGVIASTAQDVVTREPLPFGVWCEVSSRGRSPSATWSRSRRCRRRSSRVRPVASGRRSHGDCTRTATRSRSPGIDLQGEERRGRAGRARAAFEHDVRELESWERLVAQLDDVHVLVNNAARTEFRSFFEIDVDEWDDVLATNLRGVYLGCRVVGALLRDRGAGRIVNLASDAALRRAAAWRALRGVEGGRRRGHAPRRDRARAPASRLTRSHRRRSTARSRGRSCARVSRRSAQTFRSAAFERRRSPRSPCSSSRTTRATSPARRSTSTAAC